MLDTLEQFVALDVPFLPEERTKRVATLKEMMSRADVTISEKYRRILEAYQIEMDYGRTLEAYEGKLGERRRRAAPCSSCASAASRCSTRRSTARRPATGTRTRRAGWSTTATAHDLQGRHRASRKKQGAPELLIVPGAGAEGGKS